MTVKNRIGVITLNRPQSLNALNAAMIKNLTSQLAQWENDNNLLGIFIHSNSEKAFCAGGDLRALYTNRQSDKNNLAQFFHEEYALNTSIKTYRKPYIALMHGITMGGGVGISVHGSLRIATEQLVFAMPETGIGFFPDVGGSYFLSRAPGQIGTYIALTGKRLNAADAYYAKFIDIIIATKDIPKLKRLIAEQPFAALTANFSKLAQPPSPSQLEQLRPMIDHCFSANTVEEIMAHLQQLSHPWANETLASLNTKSPTSLKVTLKALRSGAQLSFTECMQMEYRMASEFLRQHDLYEGIRAVLIDKDQKPQWQPQSLEQVDKIMIDRYFN